MFVALHRPAPDDAPVNPFRGVPIAPREQPLRERLEQLALPDADRILERWRDLAAAPALGRAGRCGCTATRTPPTSWCTTAGCARSSTSAT